MNFTSQGGLSLLRILGSLSRTIGIVRQITPIYKDIKPLIQKAPLLFDRLKLIRNNGLDIKGAFSRPIQESISGKSPKITGPVFFR